MNSNEPKNKNFIILILFLVVAVAGAKTLHDSNAVDADETKTELLAKQAIVTKK